MLCAVPPPEQGLLDLARRVSRHLGEDHLARALVAGQLEAELVDVILRGVLAALLELDDGGGDLSQALVGQADDGHVLDRVVGGEEVLDLDGVEVLAAHHDDVLLAVHEPIEAVGVLACHVARPQPAVHQGLGRLLGVAVVALHEAGTLDAQLADLALADLGAVLVDDLGLPAPARLADGAHVVDVADTQVHAAGTRRLGEAVIGVVLLVGEVVQPALDQALGHRLRADVHEAPLVQVVVLEPQLAALDRRQDVLHPRHEQPDDGTALAADRLEDELRGDATQQHRPGANDERAHPMELGAGVVERRYAEEDVVVRLPVVPLLHLRRLREAAMAVQDRLGEARRAGGVVDRRVVVVRDGDEWVGARAEVRQLLVGLRPGGTVVAHVEEQAARLDCGRDVLEAPDELGTEDQHVHLGLVEAVLDLVRGVAEVERYHGRAGLEHAEVDRQPLDAVVEQDRDLVALADAAREQQVGEAVGLLVEHRPGDLAAEGLVVGGLHQVIVAPRNVAVLLPLRVDLNEGDLFGVLPGVAPEEVDDGEVGVDVCAQGSSSHETSPRGQGRRAAHVSA